MNLIVLEDNNKNAKGASYLLRKYAKNNWTKPDVMIKYFRKNVVFSLRQTSYI